MGQICWLANLSLKLPCWLLRYTWHCLISNVVVSLSKPHNNVLAGQTYHYGIFLLYLLWDILASERISDLSWLLCRSLRCFYLTAWLRPATWLHCVHEIAAPSLGHPSIGQDTSCTVGDWTCTTFRPAFFQGGGSYSSTLLLKRYNWAPL